MTVILHALLKVLKGIFLSMASEKFLQWGLFFFARMVVDSTKTTKDNVFLDKLEASYKDKTK